MPNPVFPIAFTSRKPDAADFSVEFEDPAMRTQMDGGYVVTRARYTRLPRRTWSVTYTDMSATEKNLLETFWRSTVKGGSLIFDWVNPVDNATYAVRFKDGLSIKYHGHGTNQRWDCKFKVEEA